MAAVLDTGPGGPVGLTVMLSPTMVARWNIERSRQVLMENVIIRENIAAEMAELRLASARRLERSRDMLRRAGR